MNLKRKHIFPDTKIAGMLIGLTALASAVGCADLQSTDIHGANLPTANPQTADTALVTGILQNVDSVSGEVTVQLNDGNTKTFNLDDVNVDALETIVGSAVLQIGDSVDLMLGIDDAIASLAPSAAKVEGTIFSIDTDESSLTVDAENGVQLTVKIDEQTEIKAKGTGSSSANIFELTSGMEVKVIYDAETSQSSMIQFTRTGERGTSIEQDRIGVVSAVDPIAHTITLSNSDGTLSTFSIASTTQIGDNGPATFTAIQPGTAVEIEFNPITMEASEVEIEDSLDVDEADEPDFDEVEVDELDTDEDEADEPDFDEVEVDELDTDEDEADDLNDDGTDNSGHNDHEGDVDNSGPGNNNEDKVDNSGPGNNNEDRIDEPDVDEPDVDEPDIDEPDVDEPDVDEPDVDEPDVDEPDVDEPDVDEPDVDEPDVDEEDDDEPDEDDEV